MLLGELGEIVASSTKPRGFGYHDFAAVGTNLTSVGCHSQSLSSLCVISWSMLYIDPLVSASSLLRYSVLHPDTVAPGDPFGSFFCSNDSEHFVTYEIPCSKSFLLITSYLHTYVGWSRLHGRHNCNTLILVM